MTTNALTRVDIARITTDADKQTIVPIARKLDAAIAFDLLEDWAAGKDMACWREMLAECLEDVAA